MRCTLPYKFVQNTQHYVSFGSASFFVFANGRTLRKSDLELQKKYRIAQSFAHCLPWDRWIAQYRKLWCANEVRRMHRHAPIFHNIYAT